MSKQTPVEELISRLERREQYCPGTHEEVTADPALLANLHELVELGRLVECYEFERLSSTGPCRPDGFYDRRAQFRCNGRAYDATAATATEALRTAFKEAGLGVGK
jgi:hypothetical protein